MRSFAARQLLPRDHRDYSAIRKTPPCGTGAGIKQAAAWYLLLMGPTRGARRLDADERARFEQALLPHLGAAYNLARWLTGNDHDAQDVVQEAYARAMKFFAGFHGGDGRPWLLTIIRNTWTSALRRQGARITTMPFDESLHGGNGDAMNPEQLALRQEDRQTVREAV